MTRLVATLLIACLVAACGGAHDLERARAVVLGRPPSAPRAPRARARLGRRHRRRRPRPSTGDPVADARVADLAYLVEQLKVVHPNPFLDEGEAAFMARVAAIEDEGRLAHRRRFPRRGHGPDGSSRARRPLGRVGDGPAGDAAEGLADLALRLPRRAPGRGRASAARGPRRRARDGGRARARRRRARRGRAARPARQPLEPPREPADLPDPPRRPRRARRPRRRRPGPDPRDARRLDPRGHARRGPGRGRCATGSSTSTAAASRSTCRPTRTGRSPSGITSSPSGRRR